METMADDIDIEEHNVFDNPTIKDMFPDISALKEEIKIFEEGALNLVNADVNNDDTEKKNTEVDEEMTEDSKPIVNSSLKHDVIVIEDDINSIAVTPQDSNFSNKIILGSKPTKIFEFEEDFFEEQVKSYEVSVVLDDLKPYLATSSRFCDDCLILFPQKHDLESHINKVHLTTKDKSEHMIPDDKRYKCNKCNISYTYRSSLCRHNSRQHKKNEIVQGIEEMISNVKNNIQQNQAKSNDNICFHCQKSFLSQQTLIEHLYGILQLKKYICEVCSKSFNSTEELTRHTITHKQCIIVLEKVPDQPKHRASKVVYSKPIQEQTSKTLERHHDVASNSETDMVSNNKTCKPKYYKCYICSYSFTQPKFYIAHLTNKHKINEDGKAMVKEEFDGVCKFCSKSYSKLHNFNVHLQQSHKEDVYRILDKRISFSAKLNQDEQNKVTKSMDPPKSLNEPRSSQSSRHLKQYTRNKVTQRKDTGVNKGYNGAKIESLVLKSVLFKCSKCDIHFLSSKVARNHAEHIEMLINWKCLLCKNIFKKEDKVLHEEQHTHSEKFTVHDLCPIKSPPVLYNCQKCTVHFDEKIFLNHYSICESVTHNSVFCIICDILIDNSISKTHRSEHVSKNLKPTDFIVVNSDILVKCNRKGQTKNLEIKETLSSALWNRKTLKRKSYESSNIPQKRSNNTDILLKLNYCNTCKCFLTDSDKLEVHFKEHCHRLQKNICINCGLTLTEKAFKTVHRNIHSILPNMKLKDFRFYDLKTGKPISPPMPKYSKCDNCDIHLIPEAEHDCLETDYLTCHICNINLEEQTFTLHMQFHNYSLTNSDNKVETNQMLSRKFHSNLEIISDTENKTRNKRTGKKISKKCNTQNEIGLSSTQMQPQIDKNIPRKWASEKLVTNKNLTKQINVDGVLYQCRNCCLFVDTYTKVIEHCHSHYCNEEDILETATCQICNIILEKSCLKNHQNLHLSNKNQDFFTFLGFDTFYFASDSRIWIEHVFGTVCPEQRDTILNDSIYKYECRVKMEVIQNGPADLTVYKCDKCRSFIDGTSLYKHAENSCFKLRRHPCSKCGLGFNSSVARIEHEKVHGRSNINVKSYRIVTFNKEEDKALNKLLYRRSQYYILHQCRTCSQAVDKSHTRHHKCYEKSLKTCSLCGLLIANDDYDDHILRHDILPNFIPKNIKIILFGEILENTVSDELDEKISFTGIVYDYTFYSCTKCQVCVKSNTNLEKHTCCFGTNRLKCSICKLYFATSRLKYHIKLHETDPDFLRDNMRVVVFTAPEDISANTTDVETDVEQIKPAVASADETPKLNKSNNECNNDKVLELEKRPGAIMYHSERDIQNSSDFEHKSTKIYKCLCGLHFLEASDVISHFKVCEQKSRAARQQCTKCDLLFTSDILFNHLILHHGNKSLIYEYTIVDLAMNNIIYRCIKCELHFANIQDINKHLRIDCGGTAEGKDCIFCHVKFESCSFLTHNCNNVKNVNAGIEVLDLDEPLMSKTAAARENKLEELNIFDTMESKCESNHIEMLNKETTLEDNTPTPLSITFENNQTKLTDKQTELLKASINENETKLTNMQSEKHDIELPSSTFDININDALDNQPGPSTIYESYKKQPVHNQPIQVCITTSSTQSIPNETHIHTTELVTANESNKHSKNQMRFYKRLHNSGRATKHEYHNQYHNNMRMPPWQKYQNRWHHSRGHRPRGQMQPVRPGPPTYNRYPNPQNSCFDYARDY